MAVQACWRVVDIVKTQQTYIDGICEEFVRRFVEVGEKSHPSFNAWFLDFGKKQFGFSPKFGDMKSNDWSLQHKYGTLRFMTFPLAALRVSVMEEGTFRAFLNCLEYFRRNTNWTRQFSRNRGLDQLFMR